MPCEHLPSSPIKTLSLGKLARRLGFPARYLSVAVNHVHGQSFSDLVNAMRIERARPLLDQEPEHGILHAMMGWATARNPTATSSSPAMPTARLDSIFRDDVIQALRQRRVQIRLGLFLLHGAI